MSKAKKWEVRHWNFLDNQWEVTGAFDTLIEAKACFNRCAARSCWPVWRLVEVDTVVRFEEKTLMLI